MNKKLLSLAVVTALSIGFTACGGGGSSSGGGSTATTDVEVERGKVYDANVTDSSTPSKVAKMTVGSNIYTFTGTPTYPIVASGGWIDVDGDGNMTTADIVNDLNLTSYSNVITPITSYLGDISTTEGKLKLDKLVADMNVSKEDLLKVPSKSSANAIVIANAIYKKRKQTPAVKMSDISFDDLNSTVTGLKTLLVGHDSATLPELAILVENQVVNTDLSGIVIKLDATKISEILVKRPTETTDDTSGIDTTKEITLVKNVSSVLDSEETTHTMSNTTSCIGLGYTSLLTTITAPADSGISNMEIKVYKNSSNITCRENNYANATASGISLSGSVNYYFYDDGEAGSSSSSESSGSATFTSETITFNSLEYKTMKSSTTNRVWLDRNLGATEICSDRNDTSCFGDYYQWGRNADGHEKSDSLTTTTKATSTSNVGHANFIIETENMYFKNNDWTDTDSNTSIRSANWNICPSGYRVPTINELKAEKITSGVDAYTKLKLPSAGMRYATGSYSDRIFYLWSSTSTYSEYWEKYFSAAMRYWSEYGGDIGEYRNLGMPVRCIKN